MSMSKRSRIGTVTVADDAIIIVDPKLLAEHGLTGWKETYMPEWLEGRMMKDIPGVFVRPSPGETNYEVYVERDNQGVAKIELIRSESSTKVA